MVLLRRIIGETLRTRRRAQHRTLRDVSATANVSLGYLSEIERGQKEASSELLSSICEALEMPLSDVLGDVTVEVAKEEGTLTQLTSSRPTQAPVTGLRSITRLDSYRRATNAVNDREADAVTKSGDNLPAPLRLDEARVKRDRGRFGVQGEPKASVAA